MRDPLSAVSPFNLEGSGVFLSPKSVDEISADLVAAGGGTVFGRDGDLFTIGGLFGFGCGTGRC